MKKYLTLNIAALGLLSVTSAMAAVEKGDSFNRAALGPNWVMTSGTFSITGNSQLTGTTTAIGTYHGGGNAATVVVQLGANNDVEYGAIALGNIAGASDAFVKIQSNGTGKFVGAGFYSGNNNATGSNFLFFNSAISSPAIMDVSFCGTVATLRITSIEGVQTYTHNYGVKLAKGAGLGTYGSIHLDNFVTYTTPKCTAPPNIAAPHAVTNSQDPTK